MITLLKATGGPGSIPFLAMAVLLGLVVIYVWPRRRRLGLVWLGGVIGFYLVLALPVVAHAIAEDLTPVSAPSQARPIGQLIILDGDNRRGRSQMALQMLRSDRPDRIWAVGSSWILEALEDEGFPLPVLRHIGSPANTRYQMHEVARLVAEVRPERTAVIASRLQTARVAALADVLALDVMIVSTPADSEPLPDGLGAYLPSLAALRLSADAIYEHAALYWYRRKGWIER